MRMITTTKPSPPLGAYPQLRLCGHVGNVPRSIRMRITSRIVPSIAVFLFFLYEADDRESATRFGFPATSSSRIIFREAWQACGRADATNATIVPIRFNVATRMNEWSFRSCDNRERANSHGVHEPPCNGGMNFRLPAIVD